MLAHEKPLRGGLMHYDANRIQVFHHRMSTKAMRQKSIQAQAEHTEKSSKPVQNVHTLESADADRVNIASHDNTEKNNNIHMLGCEHF